jgi:hypothetical protein
MQALDRYLRIGIDYANRRVLRGVEIADLDREL